MKKRVVVVDFDGVIAEYNGWKGIDVFGRVLPYARNALEEFRAWDGL